jgi:hypothetical protein
MFEFNKGNRRPPVVHPSIKRLVVTWALPIRMFATFTFPSLELFRVIGPMQTINNAFTYMRDFIERSNGPNLTLDLSRAFLKPVDLSSVLTFIPTLHALYLDDPQVLFSPSTHDYWTSTVPPPTRVDTIVFTSTTLKEEPTFDTWSCIMAQRFEKQLGKTRVYHYQGAGTFEDVELGVLLFSGVDKEAIHNLTDGKFPLRSHDNRGMHYHPRDEDLDGDEDDGDANNSSW